MSTPEKLTPAEVAEVKKRVIPIIDKTTSQCLKAWLKTRGLRSTAATKEDLANRVTKLITDGELKEDLLEEALIGFEEASGKRIYLFTLEDLPSSSVAVWLPSRLTALSIPQPSARQLSGKRPKPMTAVYSALRNGVLRIKWSEVQTEVKLNSQDEPISTLVEKHIVLIADFGKKVAELRLDPPENRHSYEDAGGRCTADAYYAAYKQRAQDVIGVPLSKSELADVVKALVAEEGPRVVRIHIDNHTNQGNFKWNVRASRLDMRDDPEWRSSYKQYGHTWAWDSQSLHWLPEPSGKRLQRELFSHIDAREGFLKVNMNCSDDEVEYAVSQIRAR